MELSKELTHAKNKNKNKFLKKINVKAKYFL
jgi:hypothetical protein